MGRYRTYNSDRLNFICAEEAMNTRRRVLMVVPVTFALAFMILPMSKPPAARTGPSPVPVTFGLNIPLSVQTNSQGKIQRETTIAVNPANPANIVEGNIDHVPKPSDHNNSFSFSFDGGQTWTFGGAVPLEAPDDSSADPALAADRGGVFYYAYLDNSADSSRTDLLVARSTDGG